MGQKNLNNLRRPLELESKKKLHWLVLAALVLGLSALLAGPTTQAANAADDSQFFPQTNHTVSGKFLTYWRNNGGLASFGYPITDAAMESDAENGNVYLTQWFERNSFQLHPENAGTKYEVELGLLGKRLTKNRLVNDPAFQPTTPRVGTFFFPQTKHNVDNRFYTYWQQNGSLDRLGFPISEAQQETDPATGKVYLAQWFERARMEYHPENAGTKYEVLLGLLGNEIKNSSPETVLRLFYNSINNKTYQQAYNYWDSPTQTLPPFSQWMAGYSNTASVALTLGQYTIGFGAGNAFAPVPTVLVTTQTNGTHQTFYGCYLTHKINIEPDSPWGISSATIQQDNTGATVQALLAKAATTCN
jgi:hypothetical protein